MWRELSLRKKAPSISLVISKVPQSNTIFLTIGLSSDRMNASKSSEWVTQWVLVQYREEGFWILCSQILTMKTFEMLLNLSFCKMGIIITVLPHWVVQWIISNVFLPSITHVTNNKWCLLFQKLSGKQWFIVIPWWYHNCYFQEFYRTVKQTIQIIRV